MKSENPRVKLKELLEITSSKRIFRADYVEQGVPFYRSKEIIEKSKGNNVSTELFITEDKFLEVKQKHGVPNEGDILLTSVGTLGVSYLVESGDKFYFKDGNLTWFRNFSEAIDNRFLLCWLQSKVARDKFNMITIGSTQKALTISALKDIEINLPSLPTQKKIAHILSTLDDKIELNRKMNETLEAMAQALFKSWFVDFDPVHAKVNAKTEIDLQTAAEELGISPEVLELFPSEFVESEMGMVPEGWEISTIEEEVSIYGGATPSTKEDKYWIDGENHWATPRDLSGLNSKILIDTGRKITDEGVNKISSKQLPVGTILLSSRAPVGYIAYATVPISINQGFIAMVCNKKLSNYFIMYWLDIAMNEIKSRAIGTTFSEISKSAFRPIKMIVPSIEILVAFDNIIMPMVEKIIENEKEIQTLQKTRDTLLPKLLSGELDVSEVRI